MANVTEVFAKRDVSLTCEVGAKGVRWSLTRESGRMPTKCEDVVKCGCNDGVYEARQLRQGYVVLQPDGEWWSGTRFSFVVIGKMDSVSVEAMWRRVLQDVLRLRDQLEGKSGMDYRWAYGEVLEYICRLNAGAYSKCVGLECLGGRTCFECLKDGLCRKARFVSLDRYDGVYPCGRGHWFKGVTDAVSRNPTREEWLRCCMSE